MNGMDQIIIIEDFLNTNELQTLMEIIKLKVWSYGHSSGDFEKVNNRFFSTHNTEAFFLEYIKNKIEVTFKHKYTLNRHYMHIQTFGQDGGYHIDDSSPNTYTFCIYISEISKEDLEFANGDFLIKIPNEKQIICIETVNNRGVFFPSHFFHKGMAYNRFFPHKRLCLTWKLQEKEK